MEDLNSLLHAPHQQWNPRQLTSPARHPWQIGPGEEALLPVDRFWVTPDASGRLKSIVRVKANFITASSTLEVASPDLAVGEALMEEILQASIRDSVFRNQTLQVSFETAVKDEYGDVEKSEQLRLTFARFEPVSEDDLIIEDHVRRTLQRNVVDLHQRRDLLKELGVPVRRGVLMYGPPGTGKTYACRFLCGQLPEATRIMVTGSALFQVSQVFQLARLLQPSVLFLEDVDLVFMSREVNVYSSVLGDLLDQMDGLRPFEDVGCVLTTNSIERMEAAVRDRPGRISQCIYFGPPEPSLRRRYLGHYLKRYRCEELDVDALVGSTEGATQAFLKEWVHRAVQIAAERLSQADALALSNGDFDEALREMKTHADGSTGRIVGFYL